MDPTDFLESDNPPIPPDVTMERLPYSIDNDCPISWRPCSYDDTLNKEYPFSDIEDLTAEDYITNLYLQTLWLPESIMPLVQFVKSLQRLKCPTMQPRAVHQALKPLLRSTQSTHDKYHQELPRILEYRDGAGEIEESMMWYVYRNEKYEEKEKQEVDTEQLWQKAWMLKMERREILIQILLYLHILSLPPPPPCTPKPSPGKRKRKQVQGPPSPMKSLFPPTSSIEAQISVVGTSSSTTPSSIDVFDYAALEERLETFMDKLSVWQMMAAISLNTAQSISFQPTTQYDWMQVFCEDVVARLFKDLRPDLYDLLRTKVFPHSPFSDNSDSSVSPPVRAPKKSKAKERRPPSPLRLQELEKPKYTRHNSGSSQLNIVAEGNKDIDAPQRHRSRSRSVSMAAEEVRARGASRGGVASSKTLFRGEVEMKRTSSRGSKLFAPSAEEKSVANRDRQLIRTNSRRTSSDVTVSQKPSPPPFQTRGPKILIVDTPVKKVLKVDEEQSDVLMKSPDQRLLTARFQWSPVDGEEAVPPAPRQVLVADTPVKKRGQK